MWDFELKVYFELRDQSSDSKLCVKVSIPNRVLIEPITFIVPRLLETDWQ